MEIDIEQIEKENWKKAKGIRYKRGMTNSSLAPRDYSIKCNFSHKIALVKGYFIWWCSIHHQPASHCEIDKLREPINKIKEILGDLINGN